MAEHEDRAAVLAECRAVLKAVEPADLVAFGVQVERLALHYPDGRLTPDERALVIRDWRRLLAHLPADIIGQAVDDYLMKGERFFPNVGQFAKVAEPMWKWRQLLARRAQQTLDLIDAEAQSAA